MFGWIAKLLRRTPPASAAELGRNDPCWCGSGKKYKKCHFNADRVYFANHNRIVCTASS